MSRSAPIPSGVIQKSVLGPVLFLIFLNDICDYVRHSKLFIFADDIKVVLSFPPSEVMSALDRLNEDLLSISEWSREWGMSFSHAKSNYMPIRSTIPNDSLFVNFIKKRSFE